MSDEYDALVRQNTWNLTPLPRDKNVISCKWVYRIKRHPDGSIARYKTYLVAKGYHQEEGVDFDGNLQPDCKEANSPHYHVFGCSIWMAPLSTRCKKCFPSWRTSIGGLYATTSRVC